MLPAMKPSDIQAIQKKLAPLVSLLSAENQQLISRLVDSAEYGERLREAFEGVRSKPGAEPGGTRDGGASPVAPKRAKKGKRKAVKAGAKKTATAPAKKAREKAPKVKSSSAKNDVPLHDVLFGVLQESGSELPVAEIAKRALQRYESGSRDFPALVSGTLAGDHLKDKVKRVRRGVYALQ